MVRNEIQYLPVEGKTYTLFGNSSVTTGYYEAVRRLADKILAGNDITMVIDTLQKYSPQKKLLKRLILTGGNGTLISYCLDTIHEVLKPFTVQTNVHLNNLSFFRKIRDKRLATTEEQYHLYMLEIELINRLNRETFLRTDRKISLQPYCLQDFSVSCKAKDTGFDYQCVHCSKGCFQNHASRLLKENNIESYIWKGSGIKNALKGTKAQNKTLGILGIACIPELVAGMRKCMKYKIPVVGLPLNSNRCVRWFGEFHPNSVDLAELEKLVF
jgi:hypothetical protein